MLMQLVYFYLISAVEKYAPAFFEKRLVYIALEEFLWDFIKHFIDVTTLRKFC